MKLTVPFLVAATSIIVAGVYFWVGVPNAEAPDPPDEEVQADEEELQEYYRLNVVLHRVVESGEANTSRSEDLIRQIIGGAGEIWRQADVAFDVTVERTELSPGAAATIAEGDLDPVEEIVDPDGKLHVFFVNTLGERDSAALGNSIVLVADETDVHSSRLVAHEIGYLFGLERVTEPSQRLMATGEDGTELTENEIAHVQRLLQQSVSASGQE